MNYFAHGMRFVDRPWFLAGTAVPDWLSVADRGVRVREKHVAPFACVEPADCSNQLQAVEPHGGHPARQHIGAQDPRLPEGGHYERSEIAAGILAHLDDDRWFHQTAAFYETCGLLTRLFREALGAADGHRPGFLGHIVTELLIDSLLIERDPAQLDRYYGALEAIDPATVERAVNQMTRRPTTRLAALIEVFRRERFLADYLEPDRLRYRLNQVLRRITLNPLPDSFGTALVEARELVRTRLDGLLPREQLHIRCGVVS